MEDIFQLLSSIISGVACSPDQTYQSQGYLSMCVHESREKFRWLFYNIGAATWFPTHSVFHLVNWDSVYTVNVPKPYGSTYS